jgi:hypothetical protein
VVIPPEDAKVVIPELVKSPVTSNLPAVAIPVMLAFLAVNSSNVKSSAT